MRSQFTAGQKTHFSLQEANSTTSIFSHAYTSSNSQPTADLNRALKDDRKEIQREIAMRRNKHLSSKKKVTDQNACSSDGHANLPSLGRDHKDKFVVTTRNSNPSYVPKNNTRQEAIGSVQDLCGQKRRSNQLPRGTVLAGVGGGGKADSCSPMPVPPRSLLDQQAASSLTDQKALNDLSAVYSKVIKGDLFISYVIKY